MNNDKEARHTPGLINIQKIHSYLFFSLLLLDTYYDKGAWNFFTQKEEGTQHDHRCIDSYTAYSDKFFSMTLADFLSWYIPQKVPLLRARDRQ